MLTEFGLIDRFFTRPQAIAAPGTPSQTALGIGDDCALLAPIPGKQWAISTDMLVAGRHFFADVDPNALGHKALAVNLSDLAAMGAQPRAFTLALALPEAREAWLQGFSDGLFAIADRYGCELIGGDTTAAERRQGRAKLLRRGTNGRGTGGPGRTDRAARQLHEVRRSLARTTAAADRHA